MAAAFLPTAATSPIASGTFSWQREAWRQSANLLVDEALDHLPLARSVRDSVERREVDYTRAILLLNAQPKLQRNVDEARALLESVRRVDADDDPGVSALYYLARIAAVHADPPDPGRAAALYSALVARAPNHPLAQEAVSKLAILRLYGDLPPADRRARLDEFETAVARLSLPGARRDLHFVLADVLLKFTDDTEGGLRHLLAAEQAGIVRLQLRGETLIQIALLARQLGHREVAIEHYKAFLALFPQDDRAYLLASQVKELESAAALGSAQSVPPAAAAPSQ